MHLMTGMSGYVKMRNGERICNLSVYVLHHKRLLFEVAKYDTENEHLDVYEDVLDNVIWPGNDSTHMPASNTVSFKCMYICTVFHKVGTPLFFAIQLFQMRIGLVKIVSQCLLGNILALHKIRVCLFVKCFRKAHLKCSYAL